MSNENWTREELEALSLSNPELTVRLNNGAIGATVTKREMRDLMERYPTMKPFNGRPSVQSMNEGAEAARNAELTNRYNGPRRDGEADAAPTLRARYPTMFKE